MVVFHVDVNNAFLSWESVERKSENPNDNFPDLRTIPSVIGGDESHRHGIVLAKSPLAKSYGIKTAQTLAQARRLCPSLTIVPPRMAVYKKHSAALMQLLSEYSDNVEQYSIDEAFLDMSGTSLLFGEPVQAAHTLKERIHSELGFTVNIGISTNKLLAKMASDFEKPDKVHCLYIEDIQEKMWPLPVSDLFFVGRSSLEKLRNLGIRTIGDLAQTSPDVLVAHMGSHGKLIHGYANGIDLTPISRYREAPKGYSNETTLSIDIKDADSAYLELRKLCDSVSLRLRKDHVRAVVGAVLTKDYLFRSRSHQCTLIEPTSSANELYHIACKLFDEYWDGTPLRLIGFSASKVTTEESRQLSLLDQDKYLRQEKLDHALDGIREKFGNDSITRASSITSKNLNDN